MHRSYLHIYFILANFHRLGISKDYANNAYGFTYYSHAWNFTHVINFGLLYSGWLYRCNFTHKSSTAYFLIYGKRIIRQMGALDVEASIICFCIHNIYIVVCNVNRVLRLKYLLMLFSKIKTPRKLSEVF